MTFTLVLRSEATHVCGQQRWWLIWQARTFELLVLHRLAIVVLEDTTRAHLPARRVHHYISQSDFMVCTLCTATYANHKSDSHVRKAVQHVSLDTCRRGCAVFPVRQNGDDEVVFSHSAQRVAIQRHVLRWIVPVVEKLTRCGVFRCYRTDSSDDLGFGGRHDEGAEAFDWTGRGISVNKRVFSSSSDLPDTQEKKLERLRDTHKN